MISDLGISDTVIPGQVSALTSQLVRNIDLPIVMGTDYFEAIRCAVDMSEAVKPASLARLARRFAQSSAIPETENSVADSDLCVNGGPSSLVCKQLVKQVDAAWPKEALCLERHGIAQAANILDVGTANAYFLCKLAMRYRSKRFVGLEPDPFFYKAAEYNRRRFGVDNAVLLQGGCPKTTIGCNFDFVFSRLSFHQMKDRSNALMWMRDLARAGGRICIIDVDDDAALLQTYPEPFQKLMMVLGGHAKNNGGDRTIGKKLPDMLRDAGFDDIVTDQYDWYSIKEMTRADFVSYWRMTSDIVLRIGDGNFNVGDYCSFMHLLNDMSRSGHHAVSVPLVYASGRKR
jgi:SAM-dependent methyltransferase